MSYLERKRHFTIHSDIIKKAEFINEELSFMDGKK